MVGTEVTRRRLLAASARDARVRRERAAESGDNINPNHCCACGVDEEGGA